MITVAGKNIKAGKSAYQRGDFLEAAHQFETASQAYRDAGLELDAAEMANNASVAYLRAEKAELALKTSAGTEEVFARAGDLRRQGIALGNQASALEALKRYKEAETLYLISADLLSQVGEDQLRASVMQSLSMLQLKTGQQLQALATMQSGLEGVDRPTIKQNFIKKLLQIPIDLATKTKSS